MNKKDFQICSHVANKIKFLDDPSETLVVSWNNLHTCSFMGYRPCRGQNAGQESTFFQRGLHRPTYPSRIADHNAEFLSLSRLRSLGGSLGNMYESRQANHVVIVLSSVVDIRRVIFSDKWLSPLFLLSPKQDLLMLHHNGKQWHHKTFPLIEARASRKKMCALFSLNTASFKNANQDWLGRFFCPYINRSIAPLKVSPKL